MKMAKYEEIDSMIHTINCNTSQSVVTKDLILSLQRDSKVDLRGLLELLNTNNNIDLQLKLFSALSAYLMFNKDSNLDVIIKCNAVYDKIHNVLSRGLPRKATEALNFLSALLHVDAEDDVATKRRSLALYARNMTRISGCLAIMTDMFTNGMMYHDTWKALCQCLAIACSSCEMNQSYCTHLIPVCVQKCSQSNIDIYLVLQSLVLNHNRNMKLFFDSDGISIFTRELLHYDKCLQLLTTVVLSPTASAVLPRTTVLDDLRDFLRLYGPHSQIGQKALIILNHVSSRAREVKAKEIFRNTNIDTNLENTEHRIDTTCSKQRKDTDDTKILMQNVMREIFNYKQNELQQTNSSTTKNIDPNIKISSSNANTNKQAHFTKDIFNRRKKPMSRNQRNRLHCNISTELSFSFLKRNTNRRQNETISNTNIIFKDIESEFNIKSTKAQRAYQKSQIDLSDYKTLSDTYEEKATTVDLKMFCPAFASTPKQETETSDKVSYINTTIHTSNTATQPHTKYNNKTVQHQFKKQGKGRIQKARSKRQQRSVGKDPKNTSLSARFYSAINESCTTLVKTVTNIFKKKAASNVSKNTTNSNLSSDEDETSCSYSFINYMQKRDELLKRKLPKNKNNDCSTFSIDANSCKTCDNTEVLKQKFTEDDYLKQTVKKLKLGINLYGCDFKKISKTMWPRESYMTPTVLYNLYRKLLTK